MAQCPLLLRLLFSACELHIFDRLSEKNSLMVYFISMSENCYQCVFFFFFLKEIKLSYLQHFGKTSQPCQAGCPASPLISVWLSPRPLHPPARKKEKRKETKPESNAFD